MTPLDPGHSRETEINLEALTAEKGSGAKGLSPVQVLQREIEDSLKTLPVVPERLTKPDPLIVAAKSSLEKNNREYSFQNLVPAFSGFLAIKVGKANFGRALRFMDTLIKALRATGNDILVDGGSTYALVGGERLSISLREKLTRTKEGDGRNSPEYAPSGLLIFSMEGMWGKEWRDGKLPLESMLTNILATMEIKAQETREWRLASQRREERTRQDLEKQQAEELERLKQLLRDAQRWRQVQLIRDYVTDIQRNAEANGTSALELRQWGEWANRKADWLDPTFSVNDDLLDGFDKDSLTQKKAAAFIW